MPLLPNAQKGEERIPAPETISPNPLPPVAWWRKTRTARAARASARTPICSR